MSTQVAVNREATHVARVTLQSERGIHILGGETRARLAQVLSDIALDEAVRVVVFESTGRTFIAGVDINEMVDLDASGGEQLAREGQQLMQQIADLPLLFPTLGEPQTDS